MKAARERLLSQIAGRAAGQPRMTGAAAQAGEAALEEHPEPKGPPDRTEADFAHIFELGTRRLALQEYQMALRQFRVTGELLIRSKADYAHLYPYDFARHLHEANIRAVADIKAWQKGQKQAEEARKAEQVRQQHAAEVAQREAEECARRQVQPREEEKMESQKEACPAAPCSSQPSVAEPDMAEPVAQPPALPGGGLLRGVPFNPDAPGRMAPYEPAIPQLELAPVPQRLPAVDDQTEALLNAIIGECHFYMRAVTFPSLCHARFADDRMGWIGKAVLLAETGAKVGKAVARLRHGPDVKETRHTNTIVQNRVDAGQGGGG